MADKGLRSFIKHKLDNDIDEQSIRHTLMRAGFPDKKIDEAFFEVRRDDSEAHRKVVEENGFLPPLNKKGGDSVGMTDSPQIDLKSHKGLFKGRLRRRDFILGFLFFFGLGYVALVLVGLLVMNFFPDLWAAILKTQAEDTSGLMVILLPLLFFPITVMLFSLMVRRFHNLEISGGLALSFLILFVPPVGVISYGILTLDAAVVILFILLLAKKGDPLPNRYGALPPVRGSFFRRIFNV